MFYLIAVERGCNSPRAGGVGMRPHTLTLLEFEPVSVAIEPEAGKPRRIMAQASRDITSESQLKAASSGSPEFQVCDSLWIPKRFTVELDPEYWPKYDVALL